MEVILTYHILDSSVRIGSGKSNVLSWTPSGNPAYLGTHYFCFWRKEKSIQDFGNFGTTRQYLQPVGNNSLSFTDNNISSLSSYRYEAHGLGILDVWEKLS